MSKIVTIKRTEMTSRLPEDIVGQAVRKIGGSLTRSGTTLKGLTFEEEISFLPQIVGIPADHVEFTTKVNNWYDNMNINVPLEGIKLEAGLTDSGKPLNITDYLRYRFCLVHSQVAQTPQEKDSNPNYLFYIEDETAEIKTKNSTVKYKGKAYTELQKLIIEPAKTEWVLRTLAKKNGDNITAIKKLTPEGKENKLSLYIEKDPKEFYELCIDKDLEYKAQIHSMVEAGVIKLIGDKYLNGSETIGNDLTEAIAYIKNPLYSDEYAILKARLDNFEGITRRELPETKVEAKSKTTVK